MKSIDVSGALTPVRHMQLEYPDEEHFAEQSASSHEGPISMSNIPNFPRLPSLASSLTNQAEEYSAETYQVITDASDAANKDKAAISVGGLLATAEIMNSEFERVHVADQIDIEDVHAGFCRLRERVLGANDQSL